MNAWAVIIFVKKIVKSINFLPVLINKFISELVINSDIVKINNLVFL